MVYTFNAKKIAEKYFNGEISMESLSKRLAPVQLQEVMLLLRDTDFKESDAFKRMQKKRTPEILSVKNKIKQVVHTVEYQKVKTPEVVEKKSLRVSF